MLKQYNSTHIISDLRPYICPFIPECRDRELLFEDVTEWEHHLEQEHGSQTPLQHQFGNSTLETMENFNLDDYLENTTGMRRRKSSQPVEDLCPICCVNLFPIYSAGIEGRERHVARHMENAAISVLEQDGHATTSANLSERTQSDSQSIQSWSSGSSQGVTASSDDGQGLLENMHYSNRDSGSSCHSWRSLEVMMDGTAPREAFSEGEAERDTASSPIGLRLGNLSMDMTALEDGNDEILSVHSQTSEGPFSVLDEKTLMWFFQRDSRLNSSRSPETIMESSENFID